MAVLPHRQSDWNTYLARWEGDNGHYNDMTELAGYVLDEIIYESSLSSTLATLMENLYEEADNESKEILNYGLFEDFSIILHAVWDEEGCYEDKKQILLKHLGSHARKAFLEQEVLREALTAERTENDQ